MRRRAVVLPWVLCSVGWLAGATAAATPAGPSRDRTLVVPFENVKREGRYHWLAEAAAVLVTQDLAALGVSPIDRDDRLAAFERLQVPPVASLSEATTIRLAQLLGAVRVVLGTFSVDEGRLTVTARAIHLDSGRMPPEVVETGRLEDLFAVFERVSRQLVPAGVTLPVRLDVEHGELPVFESYIKGLLAGTTAARVKFLDGALKLAPGFAPARIALWQVYTAQGEHARAAAVTLGTPSGSGFARKARFLGALSRIHLKQYDEAFQALKTLLDESPTPALLNALGVVQLRRPGGPQAGRATDYFNQAAEAEREDPDYAFNLGYAYWFEHDPAGAVHWLKEAVRRSPADGDAHFVLGAVLQSAGATVEGEREKELARQLSSTHAEWDRRAIATGDSVPKGLDRLRNDLDARRVTLVDTALTSGEQKDQQELAAFHLDRGRRLYEQQQDREATDELRRALYLSPYEAEAHLLLGRIYLRTGRLGEATGALKISIWSRETAAAHAALGDAYLQSKNIERARAELQKALQLDPQSPDAKKLAAKIEGRQ